MTPEEQLEADMETVTMRTTVEDDLYAIDILVEDLHQAVKDGDNEGCIKTIDLLAINYNLLNTKFRGDK